MSADAELASNAAANAAMSVALSAASARQSVHARKNDDPVRIAVRASVDVDVTAAAVGATAAQAAAVAYAKDTAAAVAACGVANMTAAAAKQLINEVQQDIALLNTGAQREELIDLPLWLNEVRGDAQFKVNMPLWTRTPLDDFAGGDLAKRTPWGLLVQWYRALLPTGTRRPRSSFGLGAEIEVATKPNDFWDRDPDVVMADIAEIVGWKPPEFIEEEETVPAEQRPSAFQFHIEGGKLEARPWPGERPVDEITTDLHANLVELCREALDRLPEHANDYLTRDARRAVERTMRAAGESVESFREGLAIGSSRSLEALVAWMRSPAGRDEAPEWLIRMLPEICNDLNDLAARFPETARIRAAALAVDLQSANHAAVRAEIERFQQIAAGSKVVGPTAVNALRELDEDFAIAADVAERSTDESARAAAIEKRGEILASQVNDSRNFATALVNWAQAELAEIGVSSWRAAKSAVPQAVGEFTKMAVKGGMVYLVYQTFGVVAAIALCIPSVRPDRDRLAHLRDRLPDLPEDEAH